MKTDTLIIGQGITGSLIAFMLHLRGIPFLVMDPGELSTSSRIAAGMFSPVSGKRKTIQPLVPEQISFAVGIYQSIEELLHVNILHLQNIYQVHDSIAEQNELKGKLENGGLGKYILTNPVPLPNIKQAFGAVEISDSGWVDCPLWINSFSQWLTGKQWLLNEVFLYQDLQIGDEGMEYHGIECKHIVFCEGFQPRKNPFFPEENIIPCKGDMLTIEYDQPATGRIIKRNGTYLVATGKNLFKAGATYQWHNDNPHPEEAGRKSIEDKLDALLENEYKIINHQSAIRPTTQNRQVIAKRHHDHAGMFMLNGLGTRGILQGPWFARQIVSLICNNATTGEDFHSQG
ncbi:MAG: hypothetical protein JWP81_4506 [Ferruginibacter sp.]|nr:hypothetical protein [Ferruginibacter sp.]